MKSHKGRIQVLHPTSLVHVVIVGSCSPSSTKTSTKTSLSIVAYSTVLQRRDPHGGKKKQGPSGGESLGWWYAIYLASEHLLDERAY
jgi:hypothetical protein